ncbi:MAG: CDP-alcohol phosphatidyltransferase family protein [Gammaproteobacteria bacterium]
MPSVYDLKPRFQALLRPIVRGLAGAGITANQVTVAAMLLSIATGAAIALWPGRPRLLLVLPVVLFVRMALNAVDGMLAREHAMKSRLGQVLNELGDVVSDAALYLALALVPGFDARLVVGIVVLAIIGEMTGVVTQTLGASRRYDGPMGKSDRAFVFGALGLLLGLGLAPGRWLSIVLAAVLVLGAYTIINRARRGLGEGTA